ncbi:hypothetical protein DCCM_2499 [Desulfocucumis palustris]|uniref:Lipoprotein n=2 Tax=Desulfocucumis palustris TaxID=1898651 RepID=A0A2L2XB30_9FIRM|nr:hypothetical protein DCCM_2499 [Desulfocucumis palustris]
MAGCSGPFDTPPQTAGGKDKPKQQETVKKPGDYFPLTRGSTWNYLGKGNEYASFSREVTYEKGNLSQTRTENGGTVGTAVFETTDLAVTRVFFRGEEYDGKDYLDATPNDNTIILKEPLEAGTSWVDRSGAQREIVDVKASVSTPAGNFKNCLRVKISNEHSTIYEYYKEGVGMIKNEFISGDNRVTSTLEKYSIGK